MEQIQSEWRMLKKIPSWANIYMFIYTIFKSDSNELKVVAVIEDINSVVYDVMEKDFNAETLLKIDVKEIEFIRDIADFYEIKKSHIVIWKTMYDYDTEKFEDTKWKKLIWLRVLPIRETLLRLNQLPRIEESTANIYINKNKPQISVVVINKETEKPEYEIFIYKQLTDSWIKVIWELSYVDMDEKINDKFANFTINNIDQLEAGIYEALKKLSLKTTIMYTYWDWDDTENSWETQIHRFFLDKKLWF